MPQLGSLFIISAASGSGKTSLVKSVTTEVTNLVVSVSCTTRNKRANEKDGVDYFFVDEAEFFSMQNQEEFLESIQLYNNYYATPKKFVYDMLLAGKDLLLEIDWQGARKIKEQIKMWSATINHQYHIAAPMVLGIFILPPSLSMLSERLNSRGQDDSDVISTRLGLAQKEIQHYLEYDYLVVNNSFAQAKHDLITIIKAHRLTTYKQQQAYMQLIQSLLC